MYRSSFSAGLVASGMIWANQLFAQDATVDIQSTHSVTEESQVNVQVTGIDQRVRILERLREIDQETNVKKMEETPVVTAGKDGFILRAPDTSFQLRFRYEGHFDGRYFLKRESSTLNNLLVRRARPIFEVRLPGPFFLRVMTDFGNGKIEIPDAFIESAFNKNIGIRLGKFKSPFGLEVLQSTSALPYIELSLASLLSPNRDIGAQLQGTLGNDVFTYAVGVFNGVTDGSSLDTDWNRPKDIGGRFFTMPFTRMEPLKGLGFGVAGTYGNRADERKWMTTLVPSSLPSYKTAGQETWFKYRDSTIASGNQARYSIQGFYHLGPAGLSGEYISSTNNVKRKTNEENVGNTAWWIGAQYTVTGESQSYKGIKPFTPFNAQKKKRGALEVVARVSSLQIDEKSFPVFSDSTRYARAATEYTAGTNWHLNSNLKILVNYTYTVFEGGAISGNIPDEQLLAGRVQVVF